MVTFFFLFLFYIALIFKKCFIFVLTIEFFGAILTFAPEVGAACASPSHWPWRRWDLSVSSQKDQVLCNRHTRPARGDQLCLLWVCDVRAESGGQKEWTQRRRGISGGENSRCKSRMFGRDIADRRDQKDPCAMQLLNVSKAPTASPGGYWPLTVQNFNPHIDLREPQRGS